MLNAVALSAVFYEYKKHKIAKRKKKSKFNLHTNPNCSHLCEYHWILASNSLNNHHTCTCSYNSQIRSDGRGIATSTITVDTKLGFVLHSFISPQSSSKKQNRNRTSLDLTKQNKNNHSNSLSLQFVHIQNTLYTALNKLSKCPRVTLVMAAATCTLRQARGYLPSRRSSPPLGRNSWHLPTGWSCIPRWITILETVNHPDTNRAQRRSTS